MCSQQQLAPAAACLPATDKAGYIAPVNSDYGTATYWQQRFETEASYEWLLPYDSVMEWLRSHVQPGDRILMVGCGNSAFPLDMAADGYAHVTATDLSANVVQHMQQQDQQGTRVCWQVADMLALPFPDGSFDVVIEKAAIDCFFTSSTSPWQPSAETQAQVHGALTEAHRVLSPAGVLLSISFAQPHFRRAFLLHSCYSWSMEHTLLSIDGGIHHCLYAMRKGTRRPDDQPVQLLDYHPDRHANTDGMTQSHMDDEDVLAHINL